MKPKLTKEQKIRLPIVEGPIFTNHCKHNRSNFVASFQIQEEQEKVANYDLYVFNSKFGSSVCIREGNKPQDYSSIQLRNLAYYTACEPYYSAFNILVELGYFMWISKKSYDLKNNTPD